MDKGRIEEKAVRGLLARHPMVYDEKDRTPVYAVDVTPWPRCDAEASPERGYYYHPSRHSAGQPIVAGWSYQLIAQIGFAQDAWVAPMDVRDIHPLEDENDIAAEQVKDLLDRVPRRNAAAPLFVCEAGYDPVKLQRGLGELSLQLSGETALQPGLLRRPVKRRPEAGGQTASPWAKFDLVDSETWPEPSADHQCETEDYGEVRVQSWARLHPKTRRIGECYGCAKAPVVKGTVVFWR